MNLEGNFTPETNSVCGCRDIPSFANVSPEIFRSKIYVKRFPAVLKGVDIGTCVDKWSAEYLSNVVGSQDVKVHVSLNPEMDFIKKNFAYKTMAFDELIRRASSSKDLESYFLAPKEFYYLRSLGFDPRGRDVADIKKQYPALASDLKIPSFFPDESFFSSVFRIGSQSVQLWTHYDIMDNILVQIRGRKRCVLFPPSDALNMYLCGDKSEVIDIDSPELDVHPKFVTAERYECILEPGDILFIPALWFHNMTALDFGVAVNVFWKHLQEDLYDKKDPYGNKDLIPAARALQTMENALKALETLPPTYKDFYARRMVANIERKIVQWHDELDRKE